MLHNKVWNHNFRVQNLLLFGRVLSSKWWGESTLFLQRRICLKMLRSAIVIFYIFKILMASTLIFTTWDTMKFKLVVLDLFKRVWFFPLILESHFIGGRSWKLSLRNICTTSVINFIVRRINNTCNIFVCSPCCHFSFGHEKNLP